MATPAKASGATVDDESRAMIFQGCSLSQLETMFRMDSRTIREKLTRGNVKPVGTRYGSDIYTVYDCAPFLVKPAYNVEEYIKRMHHSELPKVLTKEFWSGQRSRQIYEENAGLLWRTEKVVESVGELMKLVKMSTLLMLDAVERQTELSDRQRAIIKGLSHGMLTDLMNRVTEKFKVPEDVKPQEADDDEDI